MKSELYIFDYDGTIYDSLGIYASAVREVDAMIRGQDSHLRDEDIAPWLGLSIPDMWSEFHPELDEDAQSFFAKKIGSIMHEEIAAGKAKWYDGMEDKLEELKATGACMVILSNGTSLDRKLHWETFCMDRWFDAWYDGQSYNWKPKSEIIKTIVADYPDCHYIVVGDRDSDRAAAEAIGARFVRAQDGEFIF